MIYLNLVLTLFTRHLHSDDSYYMEKMVEIMSILMGFHWRQLFCVAINLSTDPRTSLEEMMDIE